MLTLIQGHLQQRTIYFGRVNAIQGTCDRVQQIEFRAAAAGLYTQDQAA